MDCSIIIPIGPGHEDLHKDAVSTVLAASERKGPFSNIKIIAIDDCTGEYGRSKARNIGVDRAETEWLFFLDADDLMHPCAFESMEEYTDYEAVFGTVSEYHNGLQINRFQIPYISSYDELLQYDPYLTLQMGHFVRREIAGDLPFNETMNCAEDWDYYLRLWKAHDCVKVEQHFMVNRRGMHSSGPRAATGEQWTKAVVELLDKARAENTAKGPQK